MEGEAIFIKYMEESTAHMGELLGVRSKGDNIIPGLDADLLDLEDRIQEARSGYLTDRDCRPHCPLCSLHPTPPFSC